MSKIKRVIWLYKILQNKSRFHTDFSFLIRNRCHKGHIRRAYVHSAVLDDYGHVARYCQGIRLFSRNFFTFVILNFVKADMVCPFVFAHGGKTTHRRRFWGKTDSRM